MDLRRRILMKMSSDPPTVQVAGQKASDTSLVAPCRLYRYPHVGSMRKSKVKLTFLDRTTTKTNGDENAGSCKAEEEVKSRKY